MKVLTRVAILRNRYQICLERLLLGSPVLSLEHIFKLREGVNPGEVAFLCPFVKLGDCLIKDKFKTVLAIILVDFNMTFVLGIVAMQFADFGQGVVVIPRTLNLIKRQTFVD